MSVQIIQPSDGSFAEVIRVGSDASSNPQAIAEIEEWATQNGYVRSNEDWLQTISIGGSQKRVGTCYRALEADIAAVEQRIAERSRLRARAPQ